MTTEQPNTEQATPEQATPEQNARKVEDFVQRDLEKVNLFSLVIQGARRSKNMTRDELARSIGASLHAIDLLENGRSANLSPRSRQRLERFLKANRMKPTVVTGKSGKAYQIEVTEQGEVFVTPAPLHETSQPLAEAPPTHP